MKTNTTPLIKRYQDSLQQVKSRLDSVYNLRDNTATVTLSSPEKQQMFLRLFAPMTFYHDVVGENFESLESNETAHTAEHIDFPPNPLYSTLLNIYLYRPDLVRISEKKLQDAGPVGTTPTGVIKGSLDVVSKSSTKPVEPEVVPVDVVVRKPNFWEFAGDYYLQFLQNFISTNWYKGGESSYSMVGAVTLQANYNNKQKIKWSNKLELKLGFQTSQSDTLHNLKTSEDLIRYTGKFGLQASKRWYYTVQLVANTQFMRGYRNNDAQVYSDFMSPFNSNLSFGMDYTVNWLKNKLKGSIHLAPLAYNFRYVARSPLATRYSLKEGRHTLHDLGSEFTVDLLWKFSEMMSWQTRLYAYTTYKRAELEWENTLTFQFNKFISTKIFIYPRFDDGTVRDNKLGFWQFKEYASIGFSYNM